MDDNNGGEGVYIRGKIRIAQKGFVKADIVRRVVVGESHEFLQKDGVEKN